MIIRQEKPADFVEIYDLVKVAFQTAKVSNGDEQDFVNRLRVSGNYVPALAFVAEVAGRLVGHIMLTKTYVVSAGLKFEALLLAPLSVVLDYRNCGVGSKLVKYSFESARNLGYKVVFVVGDPAYYGRFGFVSSILFGIKHVPEIPSEFVMVKELFDGALADVSGTVTLS